MKRFTPIEYTEQKTQDKTRLDYYITFKPNVLSDEVCDNLVALYDTHPNLHIKQSQGNFKFDQLNLTAASTLDEFASIHSHVAQVSMRSIQEFFQDQLCYESPNRIPKKFGLEQFRINRSANNGIDGFGNHVDVGDHESARRFLTVLYYLDTIEEGGDAFFPDFGFSCKPVKGSCLIFPSTWQYLHCGLKAISNPKYIMTTFAHYLNHSN